MKTIKRAKKQNGNKQNGYGKIKITAKISERKICKLIFKLKRNVIEYIPEHMPRMDSNVVLIPESISISFCIGSPSNLSTSVISGNFSFINNFT